MCKYIKIPKTIIRTVFRVIIASVGFVEANVAIDAIDTSSAEKVLMMIWITLILCILLFCSVPCERDPIMPPDVSYILCNNKCIFYYTLSNGS